MSKTKAPSSLADAVVDLVRRRPGASFPEIQRVLEQAGHDVRGNVVYALPGNLILWASLSEALGNALIEAEEAGRIHLHPLHHTEAFLVYSVDGALLNLPCAQRPPRKGYKDPHWLPAVYHLGAQCARYSCQCPGWREGGEPR